MRFIIFHVNSFTSKLKKKGKSPLVEQVPPEGKLFEIRDAFIVFTAVEKVDEGHESEVVRRSTDEIEKFAKQLHVNKIVIHPFAHLFTELADPKIAVKIMDMTAEELRNRGFESFRTPFGWFSEIKLDAKGHPISRIARQIRVEEQNNG